MSSRLDELLADAAALLKLSPEEMARVYRERQLIKAHEIANAAVADAKAQTSGKWFDSQKKYEAALFSGNHKKDGPRAIPNLVNVDAKLGTGWFARQRRYEDSIIKRSAEPLKPNR